MKSRFLIVGFVTVCVLVGLESIAAHLGTKEPVRTIDDLILQDRKQIVQSKEKYDVLFLGDSTAATSIIPAVFEEGTGKIAYNLGTYLHANHIADISLLKEYLSHHPAPESVIVIYNFRRFYLYPDDFYLYEHFPDLGITWKWYRIGRLSLSDAMKVTFARLVPSYRHRHTIRQVVHGLFTAEQSKKQSLPVSPAEVRSEKGYVPYWEQGIVLDDIQHELGSGSLTVPSATDVLIRRLCRTGEEHDIPVFVAMGPVSQSAMQLSVIQSAISKAQKYLKALDRHEDGCVFLARQSVVLGKNILHPEREDAGEYTQRIAELYDQLPRERFFSD